MSTALLIFYGIALAIILAGGVCTFILVKRKGVLPATVSSLCVMLLLVLIWLLPIHGGFMFLGEALFDEWSRDRERIFQQKTDEKKQAFLGQLHKRFRGELPILSLARLSESWVSVRYGLDQPAWMDTKSGLIWSGWQLLPVTDSLPSLQSGKSRCSELAPAGFWALSTEAELVILNRNGGSNILPETETGSMAYIVDPDLKMELPAYRVKGGDNTSRKNSRYFSVRCVARGPGSPERGYIKEDISLEEWNDYQLHKLIH